MSGQQVRLTESLPEIIYDYSLVQHIAKQYISIYNQTAIIISLTLI